jgi:hypothetical protein
MVHGQRSGTFRQKPRKKLKLRSSVLVLSLIFLIGGGGIFFYLQTGRVEISEAAEAEMLVISNPEPETALRVEQPLRSRSAERYHDLAKTNETLIMVRRIQ